MKAKVKNSNHPDVPYGTIVDVERTYKKGYVCNVTSNFAYADSLCRTHLETRTIWLSKNQLKFTIG